MVIFLKSFHEDIALLFFYCLKSFLWIVPVHYLAGELTVNSIAQRNCKACRSIVCSWKEYCVESVFFVMFYGALEEKLSIFHYTAVLSADFWG